MTQPIQKLENLLKNPLLILLLFVVIGLLIYSNTLQAPFVFDDLKNIVRNPFIRMVSLSTDSLANAFHSINSDRPLVMVTFAFNYYFGKYNLWGYHAVNILIHVLNGFILFLLCVRIMAILNRPAEKDSSSAREKNYMAALAASLIWFVHPLQTQSVTYITQRMTSLAALFFILSLLCYLKGREKQLQAEKKVGGRHKDRIIWFVVCGFAGLFSMGCKENSVVLPFMILLFEWVLYQDCKTAWFRSNIKWIPLAIIPGVFLYWLTIMPGGGGFAIADIRQWDLFPVNRLLTSSRVVVYYLSLLIFPHPSRLNLDYEFPWSSSLLEPLTTLPSLLLILSLIGIALLRFRKNRLLFLGIAWFFGNLVIESTLIPLDMIFEHRVYLPSMLIILAAVVLVYRQVNQKQLLLGLTLGCLVVLSVWTYQRNAVWGDEVKLWSDNVEKSPGNARSHINLALAFKAEGEIEKAFFHLSEALFINPGSSRAHNYLGSLFLQQGKTDEARESVRRALELYPANVDALINMGSIWVGRQEIEKGMAQFRKVLVLNPNSYIAHYNLGNLLLLENNVDEAIAHYLKAVLLAPEFAHAFNNLAAAFEIKGDQEAAIQNYINAYGIDPEYIEPLSNLRGLLLSSGNLDRGIDQYQKVLGIDPTDLEEKQLLKDLLSKTVKSNSVRSEYMEGQKRNQENAGTLLKLGNSLIQQNRFAEAGVQYKKILKIDPDNADACFGLGLVFVKLGLTQQAIEQSLAVLKIDNNHAGAHFMLANSLLQAGKLERAGQYFTSFLKLDSSVAEAHNNLGVVRFRQGRLHEAKKHFRAALQQDPDFSGARANLKKVSNKLKSE